MHASWAFERKDTQRGNTQHLRCHDVTENRNDDCCDQEAKADYDAKPAKLRTVHYWRLGADLAEAVIADSRDTEQFAAEFGKRPGAY